MIKENDRDINNIITFKKTDDITVTNDKIINLKELTLTAQNRKIQMIFLQKLYVSVILQIILTMGILILANFVTPITNWLKLPNTDLICFGVGLGIVVLMSLIVTFAPYTVRNLYLSICFLIIFGVCLGFIVGGLGNSIYMLTEYGCFIMILIELFIYSFFVEIEFVFLKNYLIGVICSLCYLIIIDGVIIGNWLAVLFLYAGALFFNFYAIMFSKFIIARNAEMFRIGDYIFGALKFNVDMGDIMMKISLDYLIPIWEKWTKRAVIVNKDKIFKYQETKEKQIKISISKESNPPEQEGVILFQKNF